MNVTKIAIAIVAMIALVCCVADTRVDEGEIGTDRSAVCVAEWSPTWRQGSGANEWWVEYVIEGGVVASA